MTTIVVGQDQMQILAEFGQTSPGGNGTFQLFGKPRVNNSGQVAFFSRLAGTNNGTLDNRGIFLSEDEVLSLVVRQSQTVPGGNGLFDVLGEPLLNDAGEIGFFTTLRQTSGGFSDNRGVYLVSGGQVVQLARAGQPAPDGNGTFNTFADNLAMNNSGEITFRGLFSGTSGGIFDRAGIYRSSIAGTTQIARAAQSVPGGNGVFHYDLNSPFIGNAGRVVFHTPILNTSGGGSDNQGIYVGDGTLLVQAARKGQLTPGGTEKYFDFGNPRINESGQVAFSCLLQNLNDVVTSRGVFLVDGNTTTQLISTNSAAVSDPILNENGQVAFDTISAVYRGDANGSTTIAQQGQAAPNGNGQFLSFDSVAMNDLGLVAFRSVLNGTANFPLDNLVLYVSDGTETIRVAREGELLTNSAFVEIEMDRRYGINERGQIAYFATTIDGLSHIVRWTPELHWRSLQNGDWDENANWTLSLNPGSVHDVVIGSDSPVTVLGPPKNATVKSLHIGGGTAWSNLELQPGGVVAAEEEVFVAVNGSISGSGQLSGNSTFDGLLSPAEITFVGDLLLNPSSVLAVAISGIGTGQFDRISVSGNVTVSAGQLDVSVNGFELVSGLSFEIVELDGDLTGTFDDLNEGDLVGTFAGQNLFITYSGGDGNDIVLFTNSTVLLGDVNLDGVVNLLDVQLFVERLSTGTFQAEADINGDGSVNLLDVAPFVGLLTGN